jgi:hypothetical protein
MAFLILAGSLGAVFASPAQEAAAAGPCQVGAVVKYGVSNGSYTVYGRGAAVCTYNVPQNMIVRLYVNGSLVREAPYSVLGTTLAGNTGSVWARCGTSYQVSMTHNVLGFSSTTTWSPKAYLC